MKSTRMVQLMMSSTRPSPQPHRQPFHGTSDERPAVMRGPGAVYAVVCPASPSRSGLALTFCAEPLAVAIHRRLVAVLARLRTGMGNLPCATSQDTRPAPSNSPYCSDINSSGPSARKKAKRRQPPGGLIMQTICLQPSAVFTKHSATHGTSDQCLCTFPSRQCL